MRTESLGLSSAGRGDQIGYASTSLDLASFMTMSHLGGIVRVYCSNYDVQVSRAARYSERFQLGCS